MPKAVFIEAQADRRFWLLRDTDAADLLLQKQIDVAFIGSDKLGEYPLSDIDVIGSRKQVANTPAFVLAGRADRVGDIPTKLGMNEPLSVATSYPAALKRFASKEKLALNVRWTPKGSVEAFAAAGLVDLIYDIRERGTTLRSNGLVVFREGEEVEVKAVKGLTIRPDTSLSAQLEMIDNTIMDRLGSPTGSYTSGLLSSKNSCRKKFGEESAEFLAATIGEDTDAVVSEGADLVQVMRLLAVLRGTTFLEILREDIQRAIQK